MLTSSNYKKVFSGMKKLSLFFFLLLIEIQANASFYKGDDPAITYTGRIQVLSGVTRLWSPGAYFQFAFTGDTCMIIIADELRYGVQHNYIEVVLDEEVPQRLRLQTHLDTIVLAPKIKKNKHAVWVVKNTEASIGFMDLVGVTAKSIAVYPSSKKGLIEFIGDSITCGASSDTSSVSCGAGRWEDQHNAYMSYGPVTARNLGAGWILTSVSGIGLMHSCCKLNVLMPQVFDKTDTRNDSIAWNFKSYTPDVVTICLGQNDGLQNEAIFTKNYISFVKKVRTYYPSAKIVLLTSPMADVQLKAFLIKSLKNVVAALRKTGDEKVYDFAFKGRYISGCDYHPSVEEHEVIADELTVFLQKGKFLK